MPKKTNDKVFNNVEEYRAFFRISAEKSKVKGSKYYRLGEDIARMACAKAIYREQDKSTIATS